MPQKIKCEDRADTRRVLGWVNRQRAKLGLRPLKRLYKGHPNDPERCVIAASIATVKDSHAEIDPSNHPEFDGSFDIRRGDKEIQGRLPKYVNYYANRFDSRAYPELVVNP